jgi:alpha-tubulin suppressor-like RCC1 family protein
MAQVAIGAHHALAVTTAGSVIGWGTNMKGELTIPPLTNVVQVAVGDDDEIERLVASERKIGSSGAADFLGIEAAINHDAEVAELDEHRIGTDAALAIKVC